MPATTKTPETLTAAARAALPGMASASSATKAPSVEELRARLALSTTKQPGAAEPVRAGEDYDGAVMRLHCLSVGVYNKNPRTSENPARAALKESMRAQGFNGQLVVSRRPGEADYICYAGGNTRIELIQELWQETRDPRWEYVQCLFRTWRKESTALAAHLAENHSRGNTTFWDDANGVAAMKVELEREGAAVSSASALYKACAAEGVPFSVEQIQTFLFAVEFLRPIGSWLRYDMVRVTLRPTITGYASLCEHLGIGPREYRLAVEACLDLSGALMSARAQDMGAVVQVDLDELLHGLADAVGGLLGVDAKGLQLLLAARAANPRITAAELRRAATQTALPVVGHSASQTTVSTPVLGKAVATPLAQPAPPPQQLPLTPAMLAAVPPAAPPTAADQDDGPGELTDPTDVRHAPRTVQQVLRDITIAAELGDVVCVCEDMPLGYFVDFPAGSIDSINGEPAANPALRRAAWHVLATLSGQYDSRLVAKLPDDSRWRQLVADGTFAGQFEQQVLGAVKAGTCHVGVGDLHAFMWHPQVGQLLLQLWSWALHWREAQPQRFVDRLDAISA